MAFDLHSPGGLWDKFTHTYTVRSFLPNIFFAPYPLKTVFVTLWRLSKIFKFRISVILIPVGNRIFCFTNNRGSFLKTIKMIVKGTKMCAIVNPKCNPKFDLKIYRAYTVQENIIKRPGFKNITKLIKICVDI